jgi:SAM-dependent methyltransferase
MDVVELREFYATPLGQGVRGLVGRGLARRLKPRPGETVLGLGFTPPYLDDICGPETTALAFMPARQGVIHWPPGEEVKSALVDEYDLPLLESVADAVLVVHGLELADSPLEMLQEIWRVLAPQGKLHLVVPNRRGIWAASEKSPFGNGQPFSRGQLQALLKEARFSATHWDRALVLPPFRSPSLAQTADAAERLLGKPLNRFAGVIIVEAQKQVYAFSSGKRARRLVPRFRPVLLPAPRPASRMAARTGED